MSLPTIILLSLTALFAKLSPSVMPLANAERVICSAVVVKTTTINFLTAKHCVEGEEQLSILGYPVEVVRQANRDLVLLAPGMPLDVSHFDDKMPFRPVEVAQRTPPEGSAVAVLGYPYGEVVSIFGGNLASKAAPDGLIYINTPAIKGMSGGGVFDAQGRLLTIVKANVGGTLVSEDPAAVRRFIGGW